MVSKSESFILRYCQACQYSAVSPEFPLDMQKKVDVNMITATIIKEVGRSQARVEFSVSPTLPGSMVVTKVVEYTHECASTLAAAVEALAMPRFQQQRSLEAYRKLYHFQPSVEGGFFAAVYCSSNTVLSTDSRYAGNARPASSSIYYLLEKGDFSAWHILKSDETFHHYDGSSMLIHVINPTSGKCDTYCLGNPIETKDALFQITVQADHWMAIELCDDKPFGLVGCTVAPGFVPDDFKLGDREDLIKQYPAHASIIRRLTRD